MGLFLHCLPKDNLLNNLNIWNRRRWSTTKERRQHEQHKQHKLIARPCYPSAWLRWRTTDEEGGDGTHPDKVQQCWNLKCQSHGLTSLFFFKHKCKTYNIVICVTQPANLPLLVMYWNKLQTAVSHEGHPPDIFPKLSTGGKINQQAVIEDLLRHTADTPKFCDEGRNCTCGPNLLTAK